MTVQLILLCLASLVAGAIASGFLYFRQRQFNEKGLLVLLYVLRALAFSLLFFIAVAPLIPLKNKQLHQPLIAVLVDNSSSMLAGSDSAAVQTTLFSNLQKGLENRGEADLMFLRFDDVVSDEQPDFTGRESNIAQALRQTIDAYDNAHLAAIVLVSDGIYNQGENPLYAAEEGLTPIFSLGVGDSAQQRDLAIYSVQAPRYAYRGDEITVEVTCRANALKDEESTLTLLQEGAIRAKKAFKITENNFARVLSFTIKTETPGLFAYDLVLDAHPLERKTQNNTRRFYIEVIENRKQITLLSVAPSPDVAAVREALKSVDAYEVNYQHMQAGSTGNETDLLVLFIQPNSSPSVCKEILATYKGALWVLIDPAVNGRLIDQILPGFAMSNARNGRQAAMAIDESFGLFKMSAESTGALKRLPASLQPAGAVATPVPFRNFFSNANELAALYGDANDRRTAIFAFSGLWQARMQDYITSQTHKNVDEWLQLTVQYLTAAGDKDRLRVYYEPRVAMGRPVAIRAEVYNAAFTQASSATVTLALRDEDGSETAYAFTAEENGYGLEMNGLRAGLYTAEVRAQLGDDVMRETISFLVEDLSLEQLNSRADFGLLKQIAAATNGAFFMPNETAALAEKVAALPNLKPREQITYNAIPLVDVWWLLLVAVALLATEWVLRRYFGSI